jgi:hypothetical protein
MKKPYCVVAYVVYFVGLSLLLALPQNRYDWMKDFDPAASVPQDPSGNRAVFATLLLGAMVATQAVVLVKGKKMWMKALSGALIFLALLVWMARFIL